MLRFPSFDLFKVSDMKLFMLNLILSTLAVKSGLRLIVPGFNLIFSRQSLVNFTPDLAFVYACGAFSRLGLCL